MNHLLQFAAILFLFAPAMLSGEQTAQESGEVQRARETLREFKERLKLTPQQTERVREVLTTEMAQLKVLREKYKNESPSRRGKRKVARELRDIQNAADEKLKSILSKEQMAELKEMGAERRQELRERARQR